MKRRAVRLAALGVGVFLVAVLGLRIAVTGPHLAPSFFFARGEVPDKGGLDFHLLSEALDALQRHYVDKAALQQKKLTYGAISGMVDALGDTGHSGFLTPQMVAQERDFQKNRFEGIGAEIQTKSGHVVIVAPLDNSPALRAGLRPGDVILKVNGENVSGLLLPEAVERIRGTPGTTVTLTIMTPATGKTQDVMLVRQAIKINKGSSEPNRTKVGTITEQQLREIAERKLEDLNAHDVEQAAKIIAGTARSMGVEVAS